MILPSLFIFLVATTLVQSVDETLEEKTKGADVADAVIRRIVRTGIFPDDQNLFRRIAFTETRFGEDPKTYRDGYLGGIWQVDEAYFNRTKNVTFPENIYDEIQTRWGINWRTSVTWNDLLKPFYSGLAARLFIQQLVNENKPIPGTVAAQAQYWVSNYRPTQTVEVFIREVRALESDFVCEGMMDICIVLDGSNSIGVADFEKAKGFVADLVKTFSMDTSRVAFITYADIAYEIFDFQHSLTNEQMDAVIKNASYPNANTNTPAGLLMGVDFYNAIGTRGGVPQVITTFTDGLYNRGNLPEALMAVRARGLVSFSVGIGSDIDYPELLQIALLDPKRVFMVNDYDALAEFFYHMNSATCEVPQQPALGTNQTGRLNPEERRYFQYSFPAINIGLSINIRSTGQGVLTGWFSYSEPTPNSAVNDGVIQPGSISIPPPPPRARQEGEEAVVYLTLENGPGENLGEYVILAEEGSQVTDEPTTAPTTTTPPTTAPPTTTPPTTAPPTTTPPTTAPPTTTPPTTAPPTTTPPTTAPPTTTEPTTTTAGSSYSSPISVPIIMTLAIIFFAFQ